MSASRNRRILLAVALPWLVAGCDQRQTLETEMRIAELEDYALQMEGQLDFMYVELSRISRSLSAEVSDLESALSDIHLRVADLPSGELVVTMREVEAAVAIANQRSAALRVTANNLSQMVEY
jgi:hypothetical protein